MSVKHNGGRDGHLSVLRDGEKVSLLGAKDGEWISAKNELVVPVEP